MCPTDWLVHVHSDQPWAYFTYWLFYFDLSTNTIASRLRHTTQSHLSACIVFHNTCFLRTETDASRVNCGVPSCVRTTAIAYCCVSNGLIGACPLVQFNYEPLAVTTITLEHLPLVYLRHQSLKVLLCLLLHCNVISSQYKSENFAKVLQLVLIVLQNNQNSGILIVYQSQ